MIQDLNGRIASSNTFRGRDICQPLRVLTKLCNPLRNASQTYPPHITHVSPASTVTQLNHKQQSPCVVLQ